MRVSGVRVLTAALLGGVALLAWGMAWWMVIGRAVEPVGNLPEAAESRVVDAMLDERVEEGAYFIPALPVNGGEEAMEAAIEKQRSGPVGLFLYHPDGVTPMDPALFVRGYILNAVSCLLACLVVTPGVRSGWLFLQTTLAVLAFGVVASLVSYGNLWNWMHAPTGFSWKMGLDLVGGWLLAGLVIAGVLKTSPGKPFTIEGAKAA